MLYLVYQDTTVDPVEDGAAYAIPMITPRQSSLAKLEVKSYASGSGGDETPERVPILNQIVNRRRQSLQQQHRHQRSANVPTALVAVH